MNKHRLTNLPLFALLPLLASCSGNYTFKSNVTPDNAEQYFSASKVKIFNDESEFNSAFQYIGLVEGDDCQKKSYLAPPDAINARTQARQAAFLQQANAVIFTSCVDIETKHCVAQVVCYGKAYRLGAPYKEMEQ
ncbi:rcsF protein [Colwellia sp. MT41]|uniref:Exopolysaccharide biosynthesis protein n=1 Tax=Colwellia marinimaniae TaxID=1513592 RepID=A0ABQ0MV09_9GAMM|nr:MULTISPECIES: Rcs stress response system protein RcsF [Colwellia]ALO34690.1 rcsF protein [Colwellia sp. MT41]GAW96193.1 exopolysaccharide biosynthesis protein [Colwellia marinimaniae]